MSGASTMQWSRTPQGADVKEAPRQAGPVGADAVALNDEQPKVRPGVGAFAFGFTAATAIRRPGSRSWRACPT
jgi:hypothetical protein